MTHCLYHLSPATVGVLCPACYGELRQALATVPWLLQELNTTRHRQGRQAAASGRSGAASTALPYDPTAANTADQLSALLGRAGARYAVPPTAPALMAYLPALARDEEFIRGVHRLVRQATAAVDRAPEYFVYGTCCGAPLRSPHTEGTVRCAVCGTVYDIPTLQESRFSAVRDRWVTPEQASTLLATAGLRLPAQTIRTWYKRGRLRPIAREPLQFVLGDVLDLHQHKEAARAPA